MKWPLTLGAAVMAALIGAGIAADPPVTPLPDEVSPATRQQLDHDLDAALDDFSKEPRSPVFSSPVPEYQDHYTRAAISAAATSCAIAAYRLGAINLDQAKSASTMPEEIDKPGGIDPQSAEFVSRVTGVCNEILKMMPVRAGH